MVLPASRQPTASGGRLVSPPSIHYNRTLPTKDHTQPHSHSLEEALEGLWSARERGKEQLAAIQEVTKVTLGPDLLAELTALGLVQAEADRLHLTPAGEDAARQVIRRHRLAERLLHDILHMSVEATEESACEFEHMLADQVTESICTLLGHPKKCPHGHAIPPGECCRRAVAEARPVVAPLSKMKSGTEGTVAYIASLHHHRLDKLAAFGLLPGVHIRLHQRQPSFVIQLGETTIAIDEETAADIYVRQGGK